ncbi:hypothetical protein [Krasilnikovia cinnamomea]|uniref:hypothetical protein n=1 Tax=Krasilnikovia cinnamomea TaxID=349313 RepID=UPI00102C11BF|nr:hypothetical protein [Krasilnikovia cinnamomea]
MNDLIATVEDESESVVSRGRAILEVGRRADGSRELQDRLFGWMDSDRFAAKRWFGSVTLAWVAACGLGYSLQGFERVHLAEALSTWPAEEREILLAWARHEDWFDGV